MKIRTKLIITFGTLTFVISVLYSAVALWRLEQSAKHNARSIEANIRRSIESTIWCKARDIARQIEIYLETHPFDRKDEKLRSIAVQQIQKTGYSGLHDGIGRSDGQYVFHPNRAVEGKSLSGFKAKLPVLWKAVEINLQGRETCSYYQWEDHPGVFREKFFVGVPVKGADCILFATVYVDEFYGPVREADKSINGELLVASWFLIGSAFIVALFIVGASILLAGKISGPIRRLAAHAEMIGRGKLDEEIAIKRGDEVGDLARVLNKMTVDLRNYIEDLRRTTATKERMEGELAAAHNIQQSILPHRYPLFPEMSEFDIHAVMVPAKEVAGDFYDFFFVEPRRLAFVIGDVSGKGVPAALFMAISRTLIRFFALSRLAPAEVMQRASHVLAMENETNMFVTAIYGEYDLNSGNMVLANAGHCRPLLIRRGVPETISIPADIPLGIGLPHQYSALTLNLERNDVLFLYSDGITEAHSPRGEFYGNDRFLALLKAAGGAGNVKDLCLAVTNGLLEFTHGMELADDFTMLALKVKSF